MNCSQADRQNRMIAGYRWSPIRSSGRDCYTASSSVTRSLTPLIRSRETPTP